MGTILQIRERVAKVDIPFISSESIEQTRDVIIQNQKDQLFAGQDNEEHPIHRQGKPGGYIYAERTIREKRRKGQPIDRVTLRDTEEFYKGIFVDVREDIYVTDSVDFKTAKLIENYTARIFGLGPKRKQEWVDVSLRPVFIKNFKEAAGL